MLKIRQNGGNYKLKNKKREKIPTFNSGSNKAKLVFQLK